MKHIGIGFVVALALVGLWALGPPTRAADSPGQACTDCHEDLVAAFAGTAHGKLVQGDWFGLSQACASCHGPNTKEHAEQADPELVRRFPGDDPAKDSATCLGCHASVSHMGAWPAGEHARAGLSCLDCHEIHPDPEQLKAAAGLGQRPMAVPEEKCFQCHPEVRAETRMPSHHPVLEGKMTCASCHDPHGTTPGLLKTEFRKNDLCLSCHPQYRGPFVFQHEPVEEDCTICHRPHGSVAPRLLAQTEPFLCMTCHEAHFHAGLPSPEETEVSVGGDIFENPFGRSGMKHAFLTKCTQCHVSVHGSDLPSQSTPGQGRALTR